MIEVLSQPWPWYVAGPLIGLFVPALLLFSSKKFGISSNLRHICAATLPAKIDYFNYDWKGKGLWGLIFASGVVIGGFIGTILLATPGGNIDLSPSYSCHTRKHRHYRLLRSCTKRIYFMARTGYPTRDDSHHRRWVLSRFWRTLRRWLYLWPCNKRSF